MLVHSMIIDSSELPAIREKHRGETIGLRFGVFDLLHIGHRNAFDNLALEADVTVVGVMPDEYVRRQKGEDRPINNASERMANVNTSKLVQYVFETSDNVFGLAQNVAQLRPDVYIEESGYRFKELKRVFLGALGTKLMVDARLSGEEHMSTTEMVNVLGATVAQQCAGLHFTRKDLQKVIKSQKID